MITIVCIKKVTFPYENIHSDMKQSPDSITIDDKSKQPAISIIIILNAISSLVY